MPHRHEVHISHCSRYYDANVAPVAGNDNFSQSARNNNARGERSLRQRTNIAVR